MKHIELQSADEVVKAVKEIADRHQPANYRLVPRIAQISKAWGGWVVVVEPEPQEVSSSDYTSRLVDLEEIVQQELGEGITLHVMLPFED